MSEVHKRCQEELIDVYYGEKEMTSDIKEHLKSCGECSKFWEDIGSIKNAFSSFDLEDEVDERAIRNAFLEAGRRTRNEVNYMEFTLFLFVAAIIIATAGWFAYTGFINIIIGIQFVFMVFAPFSLPFLIKKRILKEENL